MTGSNGQIRALIERIERVEEEIASLNADKSEIYKEAKGSGFDAKVLRAIVADRRKDPAAVAEFEALYDLYMANLGAPLAHVHEAGGQ